MRLTSLELDNFRNYEHAEIYPASGITVFVGNNAQGKTNVLEAVHLCCTGRSHRTPRDKELVRWEQPFGQVELKVEQADGSHEIEILLSSTERKKVKVGGNFIARSGELLGHVNGVMFSPEDLRMVKGGPAERRRFVDMELSQIRPSYYYALQRYNRALLQRNKLLKEAVYKPALQETLIVWEEQLARYGAKIMHWRAGFVERLAEAAHANHLSISGDKEQLKVLYAADVPLPEKVEQLEEILKQVLSRSREKDLQRGTTQVGPHRDDLALWLNEVDVRVFGSQGQQRTTALSLKLSELDVMREETGEWPVLMLDDVMSELDPDRKRHLLSKLEPVQVLVSCTDISDLAGAKVDRVYRVAAGRASLQE